MRVISSPQKLNSILSQARKNNRSIGFVPTMGAMHAGHVSLVRKARKENDLTVVSIFVNPAQFGPKEDLKNYPRPKFNDLNACRREGVDFVFYPKVKEIYPEGFGTFIEVEGLSGLLCGKSRPGHFRGVTTVVAKLFNITQADSAYFGQKDAQQAVIIKKMVNDLNIPVKIKILPTVREKDGLALSSRNVYLGPEERKEAVVLYKALSLAKSLIKKGEKRPQVIISKMRQMIEKVKNADIDYIAIVNPQNLKPVVKISRGCLIALAVKIGKTRLIDNILLGKAL
jgi:pantoate--beta-alanine ligase